MMRKSGWEMGVRRRKKRFGGERRSYRGLIGLRARRVSLNSLPDRAAAIVPEKIGKARSEATEIRKGQQREHYITKVC